MKKKFLILIFLKIYILILNNNCFARLGWTLQNPNPTSDALNEVQWIDSVNAIAVGWGIYKTTDKGTTWTLKIAEFETFNDLSFPDEFTGYVVGGKKVFKSSDAGETWFSIQIATNLVPKNYRLDAVYFKNANLGWIVGFPSILLKTRDGGITWEEQTHQAVNDVFFVDENIGWTIGNSGLIEKSTDGGITWVQQTSGTSCHLVKTIFINENVGWVVSRRGGTEAGKVIKTTNGGVSWVDISPANYNWKSVFFIDENGGWISTVTNTGYELIMMTYDGGTSWITQSEGTVPFMNAIAFNNYNFNGIAVGSGGFILTTSDA